MSSLGLVLLINVIFFLSIFLIQNVFISLLIATIAFFVVLLMLRQTKIYSPQPFLKAGQFISYRHYNFLIVCLITFLVLEKPIGITASLFTSFFVFAHLSKLEPRVSFLLALVVLIITSVLIAGKNYVAAEVSSKIAYYFLVVSVVWYFAEFGINKLEEFTSHLLSND